MSLEDIGDYWTELWDTVYALVADVDGFDITHQGIFYNPEEWPAAFVGLGTIDFVTADTIGTYYEFVMPIFVLDVKDDILKSKKSAVDLVGKIHSALVDDRTLGLSWLQPIESIRLDGTPQDAPEGYERQTVKLTVTAHAFLDEM